MVDLNHVFSLFRALKLRSATADNKGTTISTLTSFSTSSNLPLTSLDIALRASAASLVDLTVYLWVWYNDILYFPCEKNILNFLRFLRVWLVKNLLKLHIQTVQFLEKLYPKELLRYGIWKGSIPRSSILETSFSNTSANFSSVLFPWSVELT